jgi:hypothetical protein
MTQEFNKNTPSAKTLKELWQSRYGDEGNFNVKGHWAIGRGDEKPSWQKLEDDKAGKKPYVKSSITQIQKLIEAQFLAGPNEVLKNSILNPDTLAIEYVALKKNLILPGALATFTDNFTPKFNKEQVYGRMDPIATYQGTTRTIEFAWSINVASEGSQRALLLGAIGDLAKFMYPVYQEAKFNKLGTGTMVAPPLLRFRVGSASGGNLNLMKNTIPGTTADATRTYQEPLRDGLLGIVDSFTYLTYVTGMRGGELNVTRMIDANGELALVPTHIEVKFGITVLHQDGKVGWTWSGDANNASISFAQGNEFPYGHATSLRQLAQPVSVDANPTQDDQAALETTAGSENTMTSTDPCAGN